MSETRSLNLEAFGYAVCCTTVSSSHFIAPGLTRHLSAAFPPTPTHSPVTRPTLSHPLTHLLSHPPAPPEMAESKQDHKTFSEGFDPGNNLQQLETSLNFLDHGYKIARARGAPLPNEAEFRAYMLVRAAVLHERLDGVLKHFTELPQKALVSGPAWWALRAVAAMQPGEGGEGRGEGGWGVVTGQLSEGGEGREREGACHALSPCNERLSLTLQCPERRLLLPLHMHIRMHIHLRDPSHRLHPLSVGV